MSSKLMPSVKNKGRSSERYKRDFFRYDVLPDSLAPFRVDLERMVIRDFAALLDNKRGVDSEISISDYRLMNDKIDI